MSNPRQLVAGPTFTPLPFGITSVAQVIDDADPAWRNGVKWEADCAPAAKATLAPCYDVVDTSEDAEPGDVVASDPIPKTPSDDGPSFPEGDAFTLYAMHRCTTIGRTTQGDRDRAGRLLTNGEARALDQVLLTGTTEAGKLEHSLQADAGVLGAGETLRAGLSSLETNLASEYGGQGVIWVPRSLALVALSEFLLVREAGRIITALGTPVAVMSTPNLDDADDPAGLVMYGTGAVTLYRGAIQAFDAIDRKTNRNTAIAERSWAAAWDCLTLSAVVGFDTL